MTNAEIHAMDLEDMSQTAWAYIIIVQTLLCGQNSILLTRCMKKELHEHMGHQWKANRIATENQALGVVYLSPD